MSAIPLVAVTEGPAPPPALARLAPWLLQILAEGGAATEIYYGQRYWLRLWERSGPRDLDGSGVGGSVAGRVGAGAAVAVCGAAGMAGEPGGIHA